LDGLCGTVGVMVLVGIGFLGHTFAKQRPYVYS